MRLSSPHTELFLRGDLVGILRAIDAANAELSAAIPVAQVAAYRAGFVCALRAVAAAVNVEREVEFTASPALHDMTVPRLPAGR